MTKTELCNGGSKDANVPPWQDLVDGSYPEGSEYRTLAIDALTTADGVFQQLNIEPGDPRRNKVYSVILNLAGETNQPQLLSCLAVNWAHNATLPND